MLKILKITAVFALLGFISLSIFPSAVRAGDLDPTDWEMDENGNFWGSDSLRFSNDRFTSQRFMEQGFASSPYSTSESEGKIAWQSLQTNPKGEKIQWSGVASGDQMNGSYTITQPDGAQTTQFWTAELKNP